MIYGYALAALMLLLRRLLQVGVGTRVRALLQDLGAHLLVKDEIIVAFQLGVENAMSSEIWGSYVVCIHWHVSDKMVLLDHTANMERCRRHLRVDTAELFD